MPEGEGKKIVHVDNIVSCWLASRVFSSQRNACQRSSNIDPLSN
jgi:hypothetical protein